MKRSAVALFIAFAACAACSPFNGEDAKPSVAGPDASTTSGANDAGGDATDAVDAAGGGGDTFCAKHPGIALCDDFEGSMPSAQWTAFPATAEFQHINELDLIQHGAARAVLADVGNANVRRDSELGFQMALDPSQRREIEISFLLKVDMIADTQDVEIVKLQGDHYTIHLNLHRSGDYTSLLGAQYDRDAPGPLGAPITATPNVGAGWHRVAMKLKVGTSAVSVFGFGFDADYKELQVDSKFAKTQVPNLLAGIGITNEEHLAGTLIYAIDDVLIDNHQP